MSIQFRRGDESKRLASTEVLLAGQPFFEKDTKKLYIGDGSTQLKSLNKIEANDSDAAHLSAENTFTGSNKFNNLLQVSDLTGYAGSSTYGIFISAVDGIKCVTPESDSGTTYKQFKLNSEYVEFHAGDAGYTQKLKTSMPLYQNSVLTLPNKASGTLATTDDIVEFSGTSKYLITAYCRLIREATMWLNGEYGSYVCPGYLVAGYGSGNSSYNDDVVALGPGGLYKYPSSGKLKFTLPDEAGTLVTTAGSNTFTGDNTFTGTNTFKVTSAANYVKISSTGVRIHSDVGASPDVVLFSDYPERLCVKSGSSRGGYIQFPTLDYTITKVETVALRSDIPIKTATLSGTTLSITLS